jgi:polyferredoxin
MNKLLKVLTGSRLYILAVLGALLWAGTSYFNVSLWYVLLTGVILGVIFGKVFCRWVCPVGLMMEIFMSISAGRKFRQMYQYHKLGCPIAWVSGLLNKFSVFRIKFNAESCSNCGICDKKCYIVAVEPSRFSLYKPSHINPGNNYSCSRCLECVVSCPNGSLKYRV